MAECPNSRDHTPAPRSYVGRQEWAAAMQRQGSRQTRCPSCNLWVIWRGITPALPPSKYERGCIAVQFGKR